MKNILRMPQRVFTEVVDYHNNHQHERFTFMYGTLVKRKDRQIILLNEEPIFLADDCYEATTTTYMSLHQEIPTYLMQLFLNSKNSVYFNAHHHPFEEQGTSFSSVDDNDDIRMDKLMRPILDQRGREFVNVALVLDRESFDARIVDTRRKQAFYPLDELQCVSKEKFYVHTPNSLKHKKRKLAETSSRQDFIGKETLAWLSTARLGVCGAGGLGTILLEALVRLGVKDFVVVDDDVVEATNLNRLQGVGHAAVGEKKVQAVKKHLQQLAADLNIQAVDAKVDEEVAHTSLSSCDFLFSAVDNAYGRAALNQISVQYAIPFFDAGVQVDLDPVNFIYRGFNVLPGASACMMCSKFELLDMDKVQQAMLSPDMEAAFRARGYIADLEEEFAPSVYPLNLTAVGALMTDFINYLSGFRDMTVLRYGNFQDRIMQTTEQADYPENSPASDCPVCSTYLGKGDDLPSPYLSHQERNKTIDEILAESNEDIFSLTEMSETQKSAG